MFQSAAVDFDLGLDQEGHPACKRLGVGLLVVTYDWNFARQIFIVIYLLKDYPFSQPCSDKGKQKSESGWSATQPKFEIGTKISSK